MNRARTLLSLALVTLSFSALSLGCAELEDPSIANEPTDESRAQTQEAFDESGPILMLDRTPEARVDPDAPEPEAREYTSFRVADARITGDFGHVTRVEDRAGRVTTWSDNFSTGLELVAFSDSGVAMTAIDFQGSMLALFELEPGVRLTYTLDDYDHDNALFSSVYIIGCAGPRDYEWEWDTTAEEVEIETTLDPEHPDILTVHFRARFPQGYISMEGPNGDWTELQRDGHAQGSFRLKRM